MAGSPIKPLDSSTIPKLDLLSTSNQVAPRSFVHTAFVFPFEGNRHTYREVYEHFRLVLDNIARDFPFLAGVIEPESALLQGIQTGRLQIRTNSTNCIPLTCNFALDHFGWTFDELKKKGFPQAAFVGDTLTRSSGEESARSGGSVLKVSLTFIDHGLIMVLRNHHALIDGGARAKIFDCLSAYTRKEPYETPLVLTQKDSNSRIKELLEKYS